MFENILDVLKTCQNKRNEITRNESCGQKRIGYKLLYSEIVIAVYS